MASKSRNNARTLDDGAVAEQLHSNPRLQAYFGVDVKTSKKGKKSGTSGKKKIKNLKYKSKNDTNRQDKKSKGKNSYNGHQIQNRMNRNNTVSGPSFWPPAAPTSSPHPHTHTRNGTPQPRDSRYQRRRQSAAPRLSQTMDKKRSV